MRAIFYKTIRIILFSSLISLSPGISQNISIERQETALADHGHPDTAKVNRLNELAYELYKKDTSKARSYTEQASELSTRLDYPEGKAKSLWILGLITQKSDKRDALHYFKEALQLAESTHDRAAICNYLMAIGNISKELGDKKSSKHILDSALQIAETLKDRSLQIKLLYNISRNLSSEGDYAGALGKLRQVEQMATQAADKQMLRRTYASMAYIFKQQGKITQAMEYYLSAFKICERLDDQPGIFNALVNIAGIKTELKEYEPALKDLRQALRVAEKLDDPGMQSVCFTNMGYIYKNTGHPDALPFLQKALAMARGGNINQTISLLINIGDFHTEHKHYEEARLSLEEALEKAREAEIKFAYGEALKQLSELYHAQRQYATAIDYANQALRVSQEIGYLDLERKSHESLAEFYASTGNYKMAYQNHILFKQLNDSILNDKNIRKITQLESDYAYDKEKQRYELEKASQQLKIKSQRNLILLLSFMLILIFILFYQIHRANRLKKKMLQLEVYKTNNELELRQKEIASATLKLVQNAQSDAYCIKALEKIEDNTKESKEQDIHSLINHYKNKSGHTNWQEFETLFLKVNSDFYEKLNQQCLSLTPNERKLCVFLKLNMNNKDISQITLQSEEALKKARMRLRKKLGLQRDENLSTFIQYL
ncbi:MAG: tetratricopeptide repeat protein [Parabacteroides sp.]|nr:tetratricopeptide repeat protein [Parabacteroides sp.]